MMPLALMLLISTARRSLKEAHFAALGIISGYILNDLVTSWSRSSRERCPTDGVPLRLHQRARWSIQARFLFSLSMGCNSRDLHWYSSSDTRRKEKFPIRSFIICVLWLRLPSSFPCGEEQSFHILVDMASIRHTILEVFEVRRSRVAALPLLLHCHLSMGRSLVSFLLAT